MNRVLFSVLLLVFVTLSFSGVKIVPTDYSTIQAALDAATDGDIIKIQNDVFGYYEDLTLSGKNHLLIESYGNEHPAIGANNSSIVLRIINCQNIVIKDLGFGAGTNGVAINITQGSSNIKVIGCAIEGIWQTENNIGIQNAGNYLTVENCSLTGLYKGVYSSGKSPTVNNCIIRAHYGVQLSSITSTATIENNTIDSWIYGIRISSNYVDVKNNTINRVVPAAYSIYNYSGTCYSSGNTFTCNDGTTSRFSGIIINY